MSGMETVRSMVNSTCASDFCTWRYQLLHTDLQTLALQCIIKTMHYAQRPDSKEIVYVIQHCKPLATNHMMHGVTEMLKHLCPMMTHEWQTNNKVRDALPIQTQKVIVVGIQPDLMEGSADVNFVQMSTPTNLLNSVS